MSVDNFSPLSPEEKPSVAALMLAALVHLLLIGALFLGVQWKSQAPSSVAVEVWSAPPPSVAVKTEPAPEPPPAPEPKPEPKPAPKVEPVTPVKPDIAIKDEKKKKEEPKKPEPKKEEPKKPEPKKQPKQEEPKKPEPKREMPDFQKQLERELKDAQRQKLAAQTAQEQRARADAELRQLGQMKAEQEALGRNRGLAAYSDKIRTKIKGNIVLPHAIQGNPEAIFEVTQLPSGEVISVRIRKSSGNKLLDDAIERAIKKSDPLPLPDQPGLFQRVLELKYKPFDE